jgi:hypothetical protein
MQQLGLWLIEALDERATAQDNSNPGQLDLQMWRLPMWLRIR